MSNINVTDSGEYITSYDLDKQDKECIRRLQGLRKSGAVNMATELNEGLLAIFNEQEAKETYRWVQNNSKFYYSGCWVNLDV
jgi:hypothetical protein